MKLQIARWADTFESPTIGSRPKKEMQFFLMPVSAPGMGRRMLDRHPEGAAFLGIWVALLEITARLPLELRGQLVRGNGEPYSIEDLFLMIGLCEEEQFSRAIKFFLQPRPGWLVDLDAKAEAPSRRVVEMPLPKIEEPSIYEAAADRMLALYTEVGAPLNKLMSMDAVSSALLSRLELLPSAKHPESLALIADNMESMLSEAKDLKMVLRIDNFIRSGPCLAPRKGPKYKRGSTEALIIGEVQAGRMTVDEAKEQGVYL